MKGGQANEKFHGVSYLNRLVERNPPFEKMEISPQLFALHLSLQQFQVVMQFTRPRLFSQTCSITFSCNLTQPLFLGL